MFKFYHGDPLVTGKESLGNTVNKLKLLMQLIMDFVNTMRLNQLISLNSFHINYPVTVSLQASLKQTILFFSILLSEDQLQR